MCYAEGRISEHAFVDKKSYLREVLRVDHMQGNLEFGACGAPDRIFLLVPRGQSVSTLGDP